MYADPANMNPAEPEPPAPGVGHDPLHDPQAAEWERTYSLFMHLTLLAVHVFIPVVPALIMWLIKRDQSPFVDDHGKEALNFQISLVIYGAAAAILSAFCIGVPLLIAVYVLAIVGMILAASAAQKGRYYRYPACLRLVK